MFSVYHGLHLGLERPIIFHAELAAAVPNQDFVLNDQRCHRHRFTAVNVPKLRLPNLAPTVRIDRDGMVIERVVGELLLQRSSAPQGEPESCFHQALAVARTQQAKSLELRAAMSLSRLWQQQDKRDEARQLLAPIYGWFAEGFDTADLQEAKALLKTLS
jgi:hypothetical protein